MDLSLIMFLLALFSVLFSCGIAIYGWFVTLDCTVDSLFTFTLLGSKE